MLSKNGGPYSSEYFSQWRGSVDIDKEEYKDSLRVMAKTVLLMSPLREASGNKSTALRIGSHFTEPDYKCFLKSPKDFKDKSDFETFLEQNKVDVIIAIHAVHCANFLSDCRTPYVLIFGGTDVNCSDQFCDRFKTVTDVVISARFLVCFSKSMYEKAVSLWPDIPADKLEIIPQGVKVFETQTNNVITQTVSALLPDEPHQCHELPEDVKFFTLVAGIRRVKDPMYLVDAFSEWHSTNRNICLIIVGPILDEELGRIISLKVKKLPGVFYLGSQSLPVTHCIIKHSTALLNSSISEGMSLAILEAMILDVPVVARDIAGNKSLIEDGKTGLLYSSPQECVECCKQILDNEKLVNDLVTNGKRKVQERHSCDSECLAYIDIVQRIFTER